MIEVVWSLDEHSAFFAICRMLALPASQLINSVTSQNPGAIPFLPETLNGWRQTKKRFPAFHQGLAPCLRGAFGG